MKTTKRWLAVVVVGAAASACGGGPAGAGGPAKSGDDASESGESAEVAQAKIVAPAAGTKSLEKRSASLEFELTLRLGDSAGGMQAGSWSLEEERSHEVMASDGSSVTQLRVVYGRREAKPLLGVEQTTKTAGHTYVIEAKGGAPSIARDDGAEIGGEERDAIMSEYDWVGDKSPLMAWLGGGSLARGKSVEGGSAEARALFGGLSGVDYAAAKVKATSRGKSDGVLSLDLDVELRLQSGETTFDLHLTGPAKIDTKTGWVKELSLEGPVKPGGKVKHKKGMLDVTGKGTAKLERRAVE